MQNAQYQLTKPVTVIYTICIRKFKYLYQSKIILSLFKFSTNKQTMIASQSSEIASTRSQYYFPENLGDLKWKWKSNSGPEYWNSNYDGFFLLQ